MTDRARRAPPPPPSSGFFGALAALFAFLAGDRDRVAAPSLARAERLLRRRQLLRDQADLP
jgi:hypothetical protein